MTLHRLDAAGLSARLRVHLGILAWRWGAAWMAAWAMVLLAAALWVLAILPDRQAAQQLRAQARAAAQASPAPRPAAVPAPAVPPPDAAALSAQLQRHAQAQGVGIARSEQHQPSSAGPGAWQVMQALHADYPSVRRYVEAVLRELPGARLHELGLHRASPEQDRVEARLRWSVSSPAEVPTPSPGQPAAAPARGPAARNLFAAIAPPAAPAAAAAVPPSAAPAPPVPALPFTYLGRALQDGRWEVFVLHGGQALGLREGQVVGEWRIDRIAPTELAATWLPHGVARTLAIGDPP